MLFDMLKVMVMKTMNSGIANLRTALTPTTPEL